MSGIIVDVVSVGTYDKLRDELVREAVKVTAVEFGVFPPPKIVF